VNLKRPIVAAILLPPLLAYIYFLPPFPYFLTLLLVVSVFAMREFFVMYKVPQTLYIPGIIIGSILFYITCRYPDFFLVGSFISLFLILLIRLFAIRMPSGSMSEIGPLVVGLFYITGPLCFQFLIADAFGVKYVFLLYTAVWFADSMAYYIGTYLGRKKLYPSISPKKTFEGAFGSLLGGAIGAVFIKGIFNIDSLTMTSAIVIGIILGMTAIIGDLIESMFKRDAGVKDSSNLIPGHGGILDKIDGFLIAGPILYLILRWF